MPIIEKTKYSYNDLTIEPAVISSIKSRKECDPYEHMDVNMRDYLPLFTAPMSTIANEHNFNIWKKNKIMPMLPRNIGVDPNGSIDKRISYIQEFLDNGDWVALSLKEFEYVFVEHKMMSPGNIFPGYNRTYRVCVDLANGHMECLYDTINKAKEIARNNNYTLIVMTGNIANPETYRWICKHAEVDYIRLSIGSGSNCFVDGTKITLANGEKKNIEDINIGDEVLTIDGSIQKIENTIRYKVNKDLITINNEVTSTNDHKFFVINKEDKDKVNEENLLKYGYWIEAKNLNKNTHLLVKRH